MLSMVLASLSLFLTGNLWVLVLGGLTGRRKAGRLLHVFFATQLGKYIPGSIWNYAAQVKLLRSYGVTLFELIFISAKFLYFMLLPALAIGLIFSFLTFEGLVRYVLPFFGAASLLGFHRAFIAKYLDWRSRSRPLEEIQQTNLFAAAGLSATVWLLQAFSVYVLILDSNTNQAPIELLLLLLSANCLAFLVGLLIPFAPAGLGAREAVIIFLLAPSIGVAQAGAAAILLRLVQIATDLLFGLVSWARIVIEGDGLLKS
jgi:uncharacterized membrane protein YbhN (UPF0104 family)